MSILGAVVRTRPAQLPDVLARLQRMPGVDVALNPGDGRLVLVIEDAAIAHAVQEAANTLEQIAQWREVLNTSLVYEYSGPDVPATTTGVSGYRDWRGGGAAALIDDDDTSRPLAQR